MKSYTIVMAIGALASSLLSCATNGERRPGQPTIAIRRGSAWATYSFALPRIVGSTAELRLEDGVLRGLMASRGMDVTIRPGQATGHGPTGPVNVTITEEQDRIEVHGLWNGSPAHLTMSPSLVRASVVVGRGRTGANELSCGYQLDRLEPSGALVGSSACAGMPQETRLEVDTPLRAQLAPRELAVFLLAALAAPPLSPNEWR